jgi:hypothetical protein
MTASVKDAHKISRPANYTRRRRASSSASSRKRKSSKR